MYRQLGGNVQWPSLTLRLKYTTGMVYNARTALNLLQEPVDNAKAPDPCASDQQAKWGLYTKQIINNKPHLL